MVITELRGGLDFLGKIQCQCVGVCLDEPYQSI